MRCFFAIFILLNSFSILAQNSYFSSSFEDGNTDADAGTEFIQTTVGGEMHVVNNPFKDNINSSNKVLKISLSPGSTRRAEYHNATSTRIETNEKTHFYKWKVYYPQDFLVGADTRWLLLSQWKTWPCEYYGTGEYDYRDEICDGGGINNDLEHQDNGELNFRFRAYPDCGHLYYKYPRGSWVEYLLEIYWTNTNQGYYKLFVNGGLIGETYNVKTLIDNFPENGECDVYWSVGLYSGWTSTGADSIYYYVDDINIYEKDSGVTLADICPECSCGDIDISETITNSDRGIDNGTITLDVTGSESFSFLWNDGATVKDRVDLSADTYSVTITDASNCSINKTYIVKENSIEITSIDITDGVISTEFNLTGDNNDVSCSIYNANNNLVYGPSNVISTGFEVNLQNICPSCENGLYSLVLTSGNITSQQNFEYINNVAIPCDITITGEITNSDFGLTNGSISISVNGGTQPYQYLWNDNSTDKDRIELSADTYTVTVTDINNCSSQNSFTVSQNSDPCISFLVSGQVIDTNYGEESGNITLEVTGGTEPYTYNWSDGSVDKDRTNLSADSYTVIVTDANDCSSQNSFTISQNSDPCISLLVSGEAINTNYGEETGIITLEVTGGTEPYTYSWSDGSIDKDRMNLSADTYTVIVTDANDCSSQNAFTILQNSDPCISFLVSGQAFDTKYNEKTGIITLEVTGGTEPYNYNWSDGSTVENRDKLPVGNYEVEVIDDNNCRQTASFAIEEKPIQLEIVEFYPNPTNGLIALEFTSPSSEAANIIVIGPTGEEILRTQVNSRVGLNKTTINIGNDNLGQEVPNGNYSIIIQQSNQEYKIVVIKKN